MIDKIRNALIKYPIIFKIAKLIYRNIIVPINTGYFPKYYLYLIFTKHKEIKALKKLKFTSIEIYKPTIWRYGRGKDNAFRRYYTAFMDGKKYFIKIATKNDSSVQNEIEIQGLLSEKEHYWTPTCLISKRNFYGNVSILAIEYEENLKKFTIPFKKKDFNKICLEYIKILDELNEIKLVHSDIHAGNLMLNNFNDLYLLDFGISRFTNKNNEVDYLARPGTFYRENGVIRRYDDAYSFICLLDKLNIPKGWKNECYYQEIKRRIDRCYNDIIMVKENEN